MGKSKILVIVEGAKTDFNLMKRLINIYGISENHQIVHNMCRNGDYAKFAVDKEECSIVIKQNINKAQSMVMSDEDLPDSIAILNKQLDLLSAKNYISVLCTCVFYIVEYNSDFI